MPYTPSTLTVPDNTIIDNVLALVKRDFKLALDHFFAADNLPDFTERTVGRFFKIAYPNFNIDPDRSGPAFSGSGHYIEDSFRVRLFLAVTDADAPTVTRKAMKYACALESILRNASTADYTANIAANHIFAVTPEVSYEYGLIGKNADGYEKPVNMELTLKFNER